jgi:hypothetical protein
MSNYKMVKNIIYNIENNNLKYYTTLKKNNLCDKPETFNMIILEKITLHIFFIFISCGISFIIVSLFLEKIYGDKTNNNNNYKKDDDIQTNPQTNPHTNPQTNPYKSIDIIEQTDKQIDNNNIPSKLIKSNSNELYGYDVIDPDEIKKINLLEYV